MYNAYESILNIFFRRIDDLEAYVENTLSQYLEEEDNKLLIPFILSSNQDKEENDKHKLSKKEILKLEKKFGRQINFEEKSKSEVRKTSGDKEVFQNSKELIIWKNSKEKKESYDALKVFINTISQKHTDNKFRNMT